MTSRLDRELRHKWELSRLTYDTCHDPDTEYDLFLARASDYTQADQLQDELDDVFLNIHKTYNWEDIHG